MYISRALAMMSNNKIHLSGSRPKFSFLKLKIPHIQVLSNTFDETAVQEMLSGDLVTFAVGAYLVHLSLLSVHITHRLYPCDTCFYCLLDEKVD